MKLRLEKVNEVKFLAISFTYKELGFRILLNSKAVHVEIDGMEDLLTN